MPRAGPRERRLPRYKPAKCLGRGVSYRVGEIGGKMMSELRLHPKGNATGKTLISKQSLVRLCNIELLYGEAGVLHSPTPPEQRAAGPVD